MQQKIALTHGKGHSCHSARILWVTVLVGTFAIKNVNLDLGPLFAMFLAQKTLKQVKSCHNDTRTFGIVLGNFVLVRLERIIPDLDLGLIGLPCVLGCRVVGFF